MKLILQITAGIVLAVVVLTAGCAVLLSSAVEDDKKDALKKSNLSPKQKSNLTPAQENALATARNYLDTAGFSRKSLIRQLRFEEYARADAVWAADHAGANWNAEAIESAENYLDTSSFSRAALTRQLKFEGFTSQQAEYGVSRAYGG